MPPVPHSAGRRHLLGNAAAADQLLRPVNEQNLLSIFVPYPTVKKYKILHNLASDALSELLYPGEEHENSMLRDSIDIGDDLGTFRSLLEDVVDECLEIGKELLKSGVIQVLKHTNQMVVDILIADPFPPQDEAEKDEQSFSDMVVQESPANQQEVMEPPSSQIWCRSRSKQRNCHKLARELAAERRDRKRYEKRMEERGARKRMSDERRKTGREENLMELRNLTDFDSPAELAASSEMRASNEMMAELTNDTT